MTPGYEILEHTADIGIRAWGPSLAGSFEQAATALVEILGARSDRPPDRTGTIPVESSDREALLVDLLNEVLLVHEVEEVAFSSIAVRQTGETSLRVDVALVPLEGETETTGVKAATYHRLEVRDVPGGVEARVYLDV